MDASFRRVTVRRRNPHIRRTASLHVGRFQCCPNVADFLIIQNATASALFRFRASHPANDW